MLQKDIFLPGTLLTVEEDPNVNRRPSINSNDMKSCLRYRHSILPGEWPGHQLRRPSVASFLSLPGLERGEVGVVKRTCDNSKERLYFISMKYLQSGRIRKISEITSR